MNEYLGVSPPPPVMTPARASDANPSGKGVAQSPAPDLPPTLAQEAVPADVDAAAQTILLNDGGVWIPLDGSVAVAAYRSGDNVVLVSSGRHALGASSSDGAQAGVGWTTKILTDATVVCFHWPNAHAFSLRPLQLGANWGWQLTDDGSLDQTRLIVPWQMGNTIVFPVPADRIGSRQPVVQINDPYSGRRVLLGLVAGRQSHVEEAVAGIGFSIRTSLIGVVVDADDDAIELRKVQEGFGLDAIGSEAVPTSLPSVRRVLNSPQLMLSRASTNILEENFRRAWTTAALSEPANRFAARLRASRAALALGDKVKASTILTTALEDDPGGIVTRDDVLLRSAVRTLSGKQRPSVDEADENTPEQQFWRGLGEMADETPPRGSDNGRRKVASLLAAGLQSLLNYPEPLAKALNGPVAEWIARYGGHEAREALRRFPDTEDVRLALALSKARDAPAESLAALDGVARSVDPVRAAKAREAYLLATLRAGKIGEKDLKEKLDPLRPGARLAGREPEVLLEELDAASAIGDWANARDLLLALKRYEPAWSMDINHANDVLIDRLQKDARELPRKTPKEAASILIALQGVSDGMTTTDPRWPALRQLLADGFDMLGLMAREVDVLRATAGRITDVGLRRAINDRIAENLMRLDHTKEAMALLTTNYPEGDIPAALRVKLARIALEKGNTDVVAECLGATSGDEAELVRADLAERKNDWQGAVNALSAMAQFSRPPLGRLAPGDQELVVRLIADATRAGDEPLATRLVQENTARITEAGLRPIMAAFARQIMPPETAVTRR
ncbi:hypothetical protein [Acidomonas methanolica]|uniref:hypothetical protein n=1 Tax=Acidomonas methanolica TaxID=437 RepID=UPI002119F17D|nr:hypothetical protein [Acidomonas methanolica]MCQ9155472.1 hypothetical protein [Acidomonas methanolica]